MAYLARDSGAAARRKAHVVFEDDALPTLRRWAETPRAQALADRFNRRVEYFIRGWFLPRLKKEDLVGLIGVSVAELSNREVQDGMERIITQLPEAQQREARAVAQVLNANDLLGSLGTTATLALLGTLDETVKNITLKGEEAYAGTLSLVASLEKGPRSPGGGTGSGSGAGTSTGAARQGNRSSSLIFEDVLALLPQSSPLFASVKTNLKAEDGTGPELALSTVRRFLEDFDRTVLSANPDGELTFDQLYELFSSGQPPPPSLTEFGTVWGNVTTNATYLEAAIAEGLQPITDGWEKNVNASVGASIRVSEAVLANALKDAEGLVGAALNASKGALDGGTTAVVAWASGLGAAVSTAVNGATSSAGTDSGGAGVGAAKGSVAGATVSDRQKSTAQASTGLPVVIDAVVMDSARVQNTPKGINSEVASPGGQVE